MKNSDVLPQKAFIFDFDGTIGDTFYTIIKLINKDPAAYGIDGIDPTEIPRLRGLSVKYLLKEFKVNLLKLPRYIRVLQKELSEELPNILPFPDILETALLLKEKGYFVAVVTSNTVENVEKFLKLNNAEDAFQKILAQPGYFNKSKSIKSLVREYNLNPDSTYYIGDEVRDILSARKAGIKVISVTWGFNSEEILKEMKPDILIHSAKSLLEIAEEE